MTKAKKRVLTITNNRERKKAGEHVTLSRKITKTRIANQKVLTSSYLGNVRRVRLRKHLTALIHVELQKTLYCKNYSLKHEITYLISASVTLVHLEPTKLDIHICRPPSVQLMRSS